MKLKELLQQLQEVQQKIGASEVFSCGGFPRDRYMHQLENVSDLDVTTGDKTIQYLAQEFNAELAKKYNVAYRTHNDGHSSINIGEFKIDFSSNFNVPNIEKLLQEQAIQKPTDMQKEMFSRDFTCNALLLSADLKNISDPTQRGFDDINDKYIRTCLSPNITLTTNKNRVIRAIYLACKLDFNIDQSIIQFVAENPETVKIATDKVLREKLNQAFEKDADKAVHYLSQMNLWSLVPITDVMQPYYMKSVKRAYFQGGGGVNEPTPKKTKYKAEKCIVDQPRFKEPFYTNYDLYDVPGEHGPGAGWHDMHKYKSISEFLKAKRKKLKDKYKADDSYINSDGKITKGYQLLNQRIKLAMPSLRQALSLFELSEPFTADQVNKKFKQLIFENHPDRNKSEQSTTNTVTVNLAKEVLLSYLSGVPSSEPNSSKSESEPEPESVPLSNTEEWKHQYWTPLNEYSDAERFEYYTNPELHKQYQAEFEDEQRYGEEEHESESEAEWDAQQDIVYDTVTDLRDKLKSIPINKLIDLFGVTIQDDELKELGLLSNELANTKKLTKFDKLKSRILSKNKEDILAGAIFLFIKEEYPEHISDLVINPQFKYILSALNKMGLGLRELEFKKDIPLPNFSYLFNNDYFDIKDLVERPIDEQEQIINLSWSKVLQILTDKLNNRSDSIMNQVYWLPKEILQLILNKLDGEPSEKSVEDIKKQISGVLGRKKSQGNNLLAKRIKLAIDFPADQYIDPAVTMGTGSIMELINPTGQKDKYLPPNDFEDKPVSNLNYGRDYVEDQDPASPLTEIEKLLNLYLNNTLYGVSDGVNISEEELDYPNNINPYYGTQGPNSKIYKEVY